MWVVNSFHIRGHYERRWALRCIGEARKRCIGTTLNSTGTGPAGTPHIPQLWYDWQTGSWPPLVTQSDQWPVDRANQGPTGLSQDQAIIWHWSQGPFKSTHVSGRTINGRRDHQQVADHPPLKETFYNCLCCRPWYDPGSPLSTRLEGRPRWPRLCDSLLGFANRLLPKATLMHTNPSDRKSGLRCKNHLKMKPRLRVEKDTFIFATLCQWMQSHSNQFDDLSIMIMSELNWFENDRLLRTLSLSLLDRFWWISVLPPDQHQISWGEKVENKRRQRKRQPFSTHCYWTVSYLYTSQSCRQYGTLTLTYDLHPSCCLPSLRYSRYNDTHLAGSNNCLWDRKDKIHPYAVQSVKRAGKYPIKPLTVTEGPSDATTSFHVYFLFRFPYWWSFTGERDDTRWSAERRTNCQPVIHQVYWQTSLSSQGLAGWEAGPTALPFCSSQQPSTGL